MDPRLEKILKLPLYVRILIVVLSMVLVAVGYYFVLYAPASDTYQNLKNEHRRLEAKLIQDRRIANNLPKFKAEYERMQQRLNEALTELPNKREIPNLLTSISSLAKDQGLEILRFKPLGEQPQGFYARVPVQMKLVGNFHDVVLFFDRVGKLSRIVNMNNLQIGKEKGAGVQVDILATTFRFLESNNSQ